MKINNKISNQNDAMLALIQNEIMIYNFMKINKDEISPK